MAADAPLQVTVEIELHDGPAAGQRRFRLSRRLALPARLSFAGELPLEGEGLGRLWLELPDGIQLAEVWARLRFDPEHPELGSQAELLEVRPEAAQAIKTYIEQWEEHA